MSERATDAVNDWFDRVDDPWGAAGRALAEAIRTAAPTARGSIKWNAPNFALDDDFATFHLRGGVLRVILHTGATPKPDHAEIVVDGVPGRSASPSRNRLVVTFTDAGQVADALPSFTATVSSWVAQLR